MGQPELIYEGKTKNVYKRNENTLLLQFKDTVTGADGKIDPGANEVMGEVADKGKASFLLSVFFFEKLEKEGFPTHFVKADTDNCTMTVKDAESLGTGLEFICRKHACGSFLRRYGRHTTAMAELPHLVEITLKDDNRGDPLINDDALLALGILNEKELESAKKLTIDITKTLEAIFAPKKLRLLDVKFEFGKVNNDIVLIDEISGDNMRVMDEAGNSLDQLELYRTLLENSPSR